MSISKASNRENAAGILAPGQAGWRASVQTLSVLFKSRVVSLLVLAAIGGAFLGAGGWPGVGTLLIVVIAGGLAASGSAGLNEYLEKDSDAIMLRTRRRPLVTGQVRQRWVPWVAASMILVPSLLLLPFNPALTFFLLLGAVIYVGIYTILLKPRTLLNIVIGGAAGSAAVLSGGAAAGAWRDPAVVSLALLVFLWTPTHFWSLAILYRSDYARANVPMLPVQATVQESAWWVFVHTGAAGLVALLLAFSPNLGWAYFIPVLVATVDMFLRNVRLIREPGARNARSLFISSNIYLMIVLMAICAGTVLHNIWPIL